MTALVEAVLTVLRKADRLRGGTFKRDFTQAEADAVGEARLQGWLSPENTLTDAGRDALVRLERDLA